MDWEENRTDFVEFRTRTQLPSHATRSKLEELRGRYLTTEPFLLDQTSTRMEQMQYQKGADMYVWKRMVPSEGESQIPFIIHLEISVDGYRYHQTPKEEPKKL